MIKLKLTLTLLLMMTITATFAVPAKPGAKKTVQLADGTTVQLSLCGDEHYSYLTDAAGNPYQMTIDGRAVRISKEMVAERWTANKMARTDKVSASNGRRTAPARRVGESGTTTGKHRGLVILIQFTDLQFVTPDVQSFYNRFFNEEGFNEYGNTGSVKDFFMKQSYGQLEIDFDVVGPYTAANPLEYYGKHYTDQSGYEHNDQHPALLVSEAVDHASKEVNFRNYDWNGDGEVDQVFVIYAGYAEAQGAEANTIWPHEWSLAAESVTRKYNGVTINTYGCSSELNGDGRSWGGQPDGIGTACHEFSHCLGLPDMYDTQGNNFGMGNWDVMCSGSYNDGSHTPAGYTSYERWFSGWMEPTELKTMTRISDMQPLAEKGEAYVLYNEKSRNEYYLLENRQPTGFDKGLNGHGLLVLHVDYNKGAWENNSVNTVATNQRMTIIPADNELRSSEKSLAGDPWPGTSGNTSLTNYTTPAATLYKDNADGTKLMSKPVDNITENVEAMTVSFVACRPELGVPQPTESREESDGGFTVAWTEVSGAVGYEVELTSMARASDDPSEALQREFDFSKCYSKTAGFTDISSKLSNYGLSGWSGSSLYTTPNKLRLGTSTKTGMLKSPTWQVPSSSDITIVMGANIVKDAAKGTLTVTYGNAGDKIADALKQVAEFQVTGDNRLVLNFKDVRKELFWIEIEPQTQMYLNYLAIYDGIWTAEQLGINNAARRAKADVAVYTSATNSYTFQNLSHSRRYAYRVRAIGEENTYSNWGGEATFEFSAAGINGVTVSGTEMPVRYFDLQGRQVTSPQKHGIYIRNGRKVVY